jgi:hypothetical protein
VPERLTFALFGAWLVVPLGCGPPPLGGLDHSTDTEGEKECGPPCDECSPSHVWHSGFNDTHLIDIATHPDGGFVVAGYVTGQSDLGGGPLPNPGGNSILVGRFASDGTHLWSHVFGNAEAQYATAVAIATNGDVLLTGASSNGVDFGAGALAGEAFLLRLDAAGEHVYSRGFEASSEFARANDIAVNAAGQTYIVGSFSGTIDLGEGPLQSVAEGPFGAEDVFLAAFDATGGILWSRVYTTAWLPSPLVVVDGDANIRLATAFEGTVDLGDGATVSEPRGLLLARLDGGGQHLDHHVVRGEMSVFANDLIVDGEQDTVVTGVASGTIDFGAGPELANGAYLLKVAADGAFQWSRSFDGDSWGYGLATDAASNLLLLAKSENTDFGGGPLASTKQYAIALVTFDACGQHVSSQSLGPDENLFPFPVGRLALGNGNELYVAGPYGDVIDFGNGPLPNLSYGASYLVRFALE